MIFFGSVYIADTCCQGMPQYGPGQQTFITDTQQSSSFILTLTSIIRDNHPTWRLRASCPVHHFVDGDCLSPVLYFVEPKTQAPMSSSELAIVSHS